MDSKTTTMMNYQVRKLRPKDIRFNNATVRVRFIIDHTGNNYYVD